MSNFTWLFTGVHKAGRHTVNYLFSSTTALQAIQQDHCLKTVFVKKKIKIPLQTCLYFKF